MLVALVFVAFQPVLAGEFVDWDDAQNFVENTRWRGLGAENLAWMATTFHMGHWQPLTWLTFGVDHALFGADPRALHGTSIAWHAACALAVLFLALALFGALAPAWTPRRRVAAAALSAALFAMHPLRCESVCWITERRDVVSGTFFVLALLAWTRYAGTASRGAYWAALALCAVSQLAKAWGIVLPVLFLVIDALLDRRASRRALLLEKLPFAALSAAVALATAAAHAGATEARASWAEHGLATRAIQAGYGAIFYVWRTLLPLDLSPHYELPLAAELFAPRFLAALGLAIAVTLAVFLARRRAPWALYAWLAYLVVLTPVSGLAQAGPQLVADRYSYLACIPFALVAGAALARARLPGAVSIGLAAVILAALVGATRAQSRVWLASESLWRRALDHDPSSGAANAHMAGVLVRASDATSDLAARRNLVERAGEHFERAFRHSGNPSHLVNAGGVLRLRAELEPERRADFVGRALAAVEGGIERGRAAGIDDPKWRRTRAALLLDLDRREEARAELTAIVAVLPDDVVTSVLLARALEALDRAAEAVPHREHAARLRPDEPESWIALGEVQARTGQRERARTSLEHGLRLARARGDAALIERAESGLSATGH